MIIYSVTITLEAAIEADWSSWMREVHVPDVLGTGCFSECRICKRVDPAEEGVTYLLQYRSPSLARYQHYRDNFAPALQKKHTDRYAGRFRGSRQLLEEIAVIPAA
jgi:hypothetical protein